KRVWRQGAAPNTIAPFPSRESINRVISTSKTYHELRLGLELTPYGTVLNNIGGDALSMYAPNDPIYWLHAAQIDRLWDSWQRLSPTNLRAYEGTNYDRSRASLNDQIKIVVSVGSQHTTLLQPTTVGAVMDISKQL